jgi:hypothetical protein
MITLLTGILITGILSCEQGDDCCAMVDVNVNIHYQTQSGENLINSVDEFNATNIKIYYKNEEAFEYVYNGDLDYPNMHYVREDENGHLILTVFPSNYYEGNFSTTLIELNPYTVDTLRCEFDLENNSEICKQAWINGMAMTNRFIEIKK